MNIIEIKDLNRYFGEGENRVHILKNVRTPIHDFVRKTKGWSNTQTVFRFAIIQIILSVALIYLIML